MPSKPTAKMPTMSYVQGSECVKRYVQATRDPFNYQGLLPCIPDALPLPSAKLTYSSRIVGYIGTQGFGYAALNPWAMIHQHTRTVQASLVFDDSPLVVTNNTYPYRYAIPVTTDLPKQGDLTYNLGQPNSNFVNSTEDGYFSRADSNTPYQFNDMTSQASVGGAQVANWKVRLVGAALRVTFTGTLMTRSGQIALYNSPDNDSPRPYNSAQGSTGVALSDININQNPSSTFLPVNDKQYLLCYTPKTPEDLGYTSVLEDIAVTTQLVSGGTSGYGDFANPLFRDSRPLWIIIEGAPAGASFTAEAISFFEVVGGRLPLSSSESDPSGLANALSSIPLRPTGNPDANQVLKTAAVKTLPALGSAAMALLSGEGMGGAARSLLGSLSQAFAPGSTSPNVAPHSSTFS